MRDYLLLLHYYIFSLIQYTTFNFSTVAGGSSVWRGV
jgi:hypothetical protein